MSVNIELYTEIAGNIYTKLITVISSGKFLFLFSCGEACSIINYFIHCGFLQG